MAAATDINLDDIFNALTSPSPPIEDEPHFLVENSHTVESRTESHVSRTDSHTSHHSHSSVHAAPQAGYVKPEPALRSREPTVNSMQPSMNSQALMEAIFEHVNLTPVDYLKNPRSHQEESIAVAHLDNALSHEVPETPEPASPAPQSRRSSHASELHHHLRQHSFGADVSEHHNGHVGGIHTPRDRSHTGASGRSDKTESTIRNDDEEHDENYDKFTASIHRHNFDERKRRASATSIMSTDSLASAAESRFGNFEVQDNVGKMASQDINLEHNEVAYARSKKKAVKQPSHQDEPQYISTGGTWRLKQYRDDLAKSNSRVEYLEHQVSLQQREIEQRERELAFKQQQLSQQRQNSRGQSRTASESSRGSNKHSYLSQSQNSHQSSHHYSPSSKRTGSVSSRSEASTINVHRESNDSIIEEEVEVSQIAANVKDNGTHVRDENGIGLYIPYYENVANYTKNPKIRKIVFGGVQENSEEDKTVLLFGPVGSGKTSLINSILNYLYDVQKENDFRFIASSTKEPTTTLTVYEFNNTILPFKVTVIDTPGIPDVEGTKTCSSLIKHLVKRELLSKGAFRLDAISIVLRYDEVNLGWPFINELAEVRTIFGEDLKTNVMPIITHSQVLPQPIAIRSLVQANIVFVEYYKVNNSGFFPTPPADVTKLNHSLFFKHGIASLENFFKGLQEMIHPLVAVLRNHPTGPLSPVLNNAHLY